MRPIRIGELVGRGRTRADLVMQRLPGPTMLRALADAAMTPRGPMVIDWAMSALILAQGGGGPGHGYARSPR
ncbi:hypothetical protein [Nonomuraea africana]|uniref:Uncharacterized protein n=1 Tax=Nonomuraea africana TaxID=46171 RepID=A0ABR9KC99_9ACTN|nr:hypothetical protein [Nonomuraea africana]MBE1559455.1 hypothetical protein [Nonomuraea africana]